MDTGPGAELGWGLRRGLQAGDEIRALHILYGTRSLAALATDVFSLAVQFQMFLHSSVFHVLGRR